MSICIYFEKRDVWVGAYWTREGYDRRLYLCLVPCLPIRVTWRSRRYVVD